MAGDDGRGDDGWRPARIVGIRRETARATSFQLDLGTPTPHLAGQHVKLRVPTAEGSTSRSYSIASAPSRSTTIALTVERLEGGRVSGHLHDRARVGDVLEVRGPRGRFTWEATTPAVLIGGGSGLVPLMSMLRHARVTGQAGLVRMLASARTGADLLYAGELAGLETTTILTRAPASLLRAPGRLTAEDLAPVLVPGATAYVCGPTGFVAHVRGLLEAMGHPADALRTEAFGPSEDPPAEPVDPPRPAVLTQQDRT